MDIIDVIIATIVCSVLALIVTAVYFIRSQIPNWPFYSKDK